MEAQTFLDNFGTIADAPGGVDRLRELIVSLAVRGQLGTGDANDEPATELLDRTTGKWSVASGFHSLPENWAWVPTVHVLDHQLGKMLNTGKMSGSPVRYLRSVNVRESGRVDVSDLNEMLLEPDEMGKYSVQVGDIFVIEGGDAGRSSIWRGELDEPLAFQNQLHRLRAKGGMPPEYFLLALKHSKNSGVIASLASGVTIHHFSASKLRAMPMPVPPLAEQERIVAKVDELMELCDNLEARQQARYHATTRLRVSSLDALTNAETHDDLHTAWSRIHVNWEALTDQPESIEALRQTILQLAVRGLLVEHDPSPAATAGDLMEATKQRRGELSEARGLRRPKELSSLSELPKPFDLSAGWAWARFTELGELARGRSQHRPRNDPALYTDGTIPLVQTGDVARADGQIDTWSALYNQRGVEQSRLWPAGTLCITIAANIADSALLRFDACFPDSVVGFVPFEPIPDARYFEYFMRTAQAHLEQFAPSTAQKNINLAILDELLIPLPPLAEMRRIVDKVEALLTLCDSLGSRLSERDKASDMLAKSLVGAA